MSRILIVHNLPSNDALLSRMAGVLEVPESNIILIKLKKGFTKNLPSDIDEIILAGGNDLQLSKEPELKNEVFNFIIECNMPLIGICFGAQLIARAYGAGVVRLPEPLARISTIRIIKDKRFFSGNYMQTVYSRHSWSLQNLPDEFSIYAVSTSGIEIFRHKTKQIAGVQFHPELYTKACKGAKVFKQLRKLVTQK